MHDRFHISKHLNEAVDKVRQAEHKELMGEGDETLKGTRQLWLYNPENISDEQWEQFEQLRDMELKTARAYALRESFRWFWEARPCRRPMGEDKGQGRGSSEAAGWAEKFFGRWYVWACRCRMQPIQKVAKMLKKHLGNLMTWFRHRISNGPVTPPWEGFNSRIQSIKSAARGFRNFANYHTRVLLFCGKPQPTARDYPLKEGKNLIFEMLRLHRPRCLPTSR